MNTLVLSAGARAHDAERQLVCVLYAHDVSAVLSQGRSVVPAATLGSLSKEGLLDLDLDFIPELCGTRRASLALGTGRPQA